MSESYSGDDPLPTVPLEYFQQSNAAWRRVAKWGAWMAFAYGVFVIAATMPMLLYYFLPTAGHTQIMIVSEQMIVTTAPSIVSAILLVIGAIMLLMQGPGGRGLLIGSCIGLIASAGIVFLFGVYQYSLSGNYRQFGPGFPIYQVSSQFFNLLRISFVPGTLILLFSRRELRET